MLSSTERISSLALSVGVFVVALLLLAWQWLERRRRPTSASADDDAYFGRRDPRRLAVSGVMLALAAGIYFGGRIPHLRDGRPNVLFVEVWGVVFALILVLLALALVDWVATRDYANRQRKAIAEEGIERLRSELKARPGGSANGHPSGG